MGFLADFIDGAIQAGINSLSKEELEKSLRETREEIILFNRYLEGLIRIYGQDGLKKSGVWAELNLFASKLEVLEAYIVEQDSLPLSQRNNSEIYSAVTNERQVIQKLAEKIYAVVGDVPEDDEDEDEDFDEDDDNNDNAETTSLGDDVISDHCMATYTLHGSAINLYSFVLVAIQDIFDKETLKKHNIEVTGSNDREITFYLKANTETYKKVYRQQFTGEVGTITDAVLLHVRVVCSNANILSKLLLGNINRNEIEPHVLESFTSPAFAEIEILKKKLAEKADGTIFDLTDRYRPILDKLEKLLQ